MNIRKIALSSAGIIGLVAALGATPVLAHSSHPATAAENAQTDQLNQQALAAAQGGGTATPAATAPNAMTPDQQGGTGGTSTMSPTAPAQNNTGTVTRDQSTAPGTASPNAMTPNTTAPDTTPTPAPSPNDTNKTAPDNSAAPTATNQDPAAPQPASGIAPKTPQ